MMNVVEVTWLWVMLALPLAGAAVLASLGRRWSERTVSLVAVAAVAVPFAFAVVALGRLFEVQSLHQRLWGLVSLPPIHVDVAFSIDRLSAVMVLVTTGVGSLIHLYATAYMAKDKGFARFFAAMNLFVFSMLLLVMADNPWLLFFGWECVGLSSWLLIGFWYEEVSNARAGLKAFVTNRVGDVGMVVALCALTWAVYGDGQGGAPASFTFERLNLLASYGSPMWERLHTTAIAGLSWGAVIALCLWWAAAAKSAQLPLFTWLPDAMAGPTPVSALIHAATMVTAGVYLLARLQFVFAVDERVGMVVAGAGALTAAIGALAACTQSDLKKILAYSTVSQLGLMFVALGSGAVWAAVYHVVTHAFFKAALFLAAGVVIHSTDGEQDVARLGGLGPKLPRTAGLYLYACLAIAGFPLAGGFFSKDAILEGAASGTVGWPMGVRTGVLALSWAAAFGTAFYAFRSYRLTFTGAYRGLATIHSPGSRLVWPPIVLGAAAGLSAVLGMWPALHVTPLFERWLGAEVQSQHEGWLVAVASVVVAIAGWWLARRLYLGGRSSLNIRVRLRRTYALAAGAFYFDALYTEVVVPGVVQLARAAAVFDRVLIDGLVALIGWLARAVAALDAFVDAAVFDGIVNLVGFVLQRIGRLARRLQTGAVPDYLFVAIASVLLVAGVGWWLSGGLP